MNCRHCGHLLTHTLIDLGTAPPSNAYLTAADLRGPERWYPLRVLVCDQCWLVQTEDFLEREHLFTNNYAYFSSISSTWLAHAEAYVAKVIGCLGLSARSLVVEVAANDGYLLQYVQKAGIPCLGIEPTASTAAAARAKGIPIIERFFGKALAEELAQAGKAADLMVANNVLAHVPDINDFVSGFALLLKPQGVATFEFPHLLRLVQEHQFDTIYHEHYSYLSLTTLQGIFAKNGLVVFDAETIPTHGGSLRVYAQRMGTGTQPISPRVAELLAQEEAAGVTKLSFYEELQTAAERIKDNLLLFLLEAKRQGRKVVGYGAAAKGNTLLNFAGIRADLLPYVVDKNPAKQGKFLPGSRIPIVSEAKIQQERPDNILILPWNLREEVLAQLNYVQEWGGQFMTAVPELHLWDTIVR
ncbi:class I SAM-dependent methyltransferase [Parathermosynechococcus lividus]